ncbi:MAG: J domain-containing protein [Planctomycetota bacterium]
MARCWHCEQEANDSLEYEAVLVPRTAERGGPLYVYRCPGCGVDCVLERNAPGEHLLSPPHLAGIRSITVRGSTFSAARSWAAEHREERREFLSRDGPPREDVEPPEAPPPDPPMEDQDPASSAAKEEAPAGEDLSDASDFLEAYAVLDLPLTAKPDEVRKRYRQLSKKCHPDRVADLDEEIRRVAAERFRRISEAYERIRDQL